MTGTNRPPVWHAYARLCGFLKGRRCGGCRPRSTHRARPSCCAQPPRRARRTTPGDHHVQAVSSVLNSCKTTADRFSANGDEVVQILHAKVDLVDLFNVRADTVVSAQSLPDRRLHACSDDFTNSYEPRHDLGKTMHEQIAIWKRETSVCSG